MESRFGWVIANLFYDKTMEMPDISDLPAWRILLAVQEKRTDQRFAEMQLRMHLRYDEKGTGVVERFREWAETVVPVLADERKKQDLALKRQLESLAQMGPLRVEPVGGMHAMQSIRYAQSLVRKVM